MKVFKVVTRQPPRTRRTKVANFAIVVICFPFIAVLAMLEGLTENA